MPVVAKTFAVAILLWLGASPTQLPFHLAWERITAKYSPAINDNLSREQCVPESTRMM